MSVFFSRLINNDHYIVIDPSLMQYSGKIVLTAEYGIANGIPDTDGK